MLLFAAVLPCFCNLSNSVFADCIYSGRGLVSSYSGEFGGFYLSTVRCVVKRNTSSRRRRQLHPSSFCCAVASKCNGVVAEWNDFTSEWNKRLNKHLRCMKQSCWLWSTLSAYEAKPWQASCFFSGIRAKKMGWQFLFPHLVFTGESSNLSLCEFNQLQNC